jgi:hypothetical protein
MCAQVTHRLQVVMVKRKDPEQTRKQGARKPQRPSRSMSFFARSLSSGHKRTLSLPAKTKADAREPIADSNALKRNRNRSHTECLPGLHSKSVLSTESNGTTSTRPRAGRQVSFSASSPSQACSTDEGIDSLPSNPARCTSSNHEAFNTQNPRTTSVFAFPGKLVSDAIHVNGDVVVEDPDKFASTTADMLRNAHGRSLHQRSHPDSASTQLNKELAQQLKDCFQQEAFAHPRENQHVNRHVNRLQERFGRLGTLRDSNCRAWAAVVHLAADTAGMCAGSHGDFFVVYSGYVDDNRATDNAWIETVAIHMHCPFDLGADLNLHPGVDVDEAIWVDVSTSIESVLKERNSMYATGSHLLPATCSFYASQTCRLSKVRLSRGMASKGQSKDGRTQYLTSINAGEVGALRCCRTRATRPRATRSSTGKHQRECSTMQHSHANRLVLVVAAGSRSPACTAAGVATRSNRARLQY